MAGAISAPGSMMGQLRQEAMVSFFLIIVSSSLFLLFFFSRVPVSLEYEDYHTIQSSQHPGVVEDIGLFQTASPADVDSKVIKRNTSILPAAR